MQYVQNQQDAEEITQDVFISIHSTLKDFRHEARISTWVYRITVNKSIDFIRQKKRKKRFGFLYALSSDEQFLVRDFDHPGVKMEQKESIEQIFRCLNQLPDNQKTALILARIEQKTHAEIAEIMQLTPKAVESLVQRGKVKLLKLLNNEG